MKMSLKTLNKLHINNWHKLKKFKMMQDQKYLRIQQITAAEKLCLNAIQGLQVSTKWDKLNMHDRSTLDSLCPLENV